MVGTGLVNPYEQQAQAAAAPTAAPAAAPSASPGNGIGGQLPWGGGGAGLFQGLGGDPATTLANLGTNYANAYNSSLQMNQANYNNILAGYQKLSGDVMGGIAGIGSDQLNLINRNYANQAGTADQNLINSGLGNSTVRSSVQRGIGLDQNLAQNNLANSIAQTKAGYQSNLGLDQLHWMNSVNADYPNAAMYSQLAQQAGAAQQSNLNRAQMDRLAGQNSDLGAQVRQAGILGGSGGLAPGTGGRLPPSAVNYAAQPSGTAGAGGLGGGYGGSRGGMTGAGVGAQNVSLAGGGTGDLWGLLGDWGSGGGIDSSYDTWQGYDAGQTGLDAFGGGYDALGGYDNSGYDSWQGYDAGAMGSDAFAAAGYYPSGGYLDWQGYDPMPTGADAFSGAYDAFGGGDSYDYFW